MLSLQVRNFVPPQTEDPEIYIMDQEAYTGHYGGDGTKPGSLSLARLVLFCIHKYTWLHQNFLTQQTLYLSFWWTSEAYGVCGNSTLPDLSLLSLVKNERESDVMLRRNLILGLAVSGFM